MAAYVNENAAINTQLTVTVTMPHWNKRKQGWEALSWNRMASSVVPLAIC